MSEELAAVVDPDVSQAAAAPVVEQPPIEPQAAPEPQEEDIPEAVEVQPGVRVVPVGVVQALRAELKALKPQAQRSVALERELGENRAVVEFIKSNPHLMQTPQVPAQAAPDPADDPGLVDLARTLDLYTQDGKPDTGRAAKIQAFSDSRAHAVAQQAIAPMQEATHEQQAAAHVQQIMTTTKVGGKPLDPQYLKTAIQTITASVPKADAMRILADPNVAGVVRRVAQGLQAEAMGQDPPVVAAPAAAPLYRESPGGGSDQIVLSENSKRLARSAGISEKHYVDRARKFVPNKSNVLE